MLDKFTKAIHNRNKIRLTFYSKDDGMNTTRKCAPMDYALSRRYKDGLIRFHLWDYESDTQNHNLDLLPENIKNMEVLSETFDPREFVTWNTQTSPWSIKRDWGQYS